MKPLPGALGGELLWGHVLVVVVVTPRAERRIARETLGVLVLTEYVGGPGLALVAALAAA
jgi:hypothetical protein